MLPDDSHRPHKIASFPELNGSFSYTLQKFPTTDEDDMDIDVHEDGNSGGDFGSGTKLTRPGESITSSRSLHAVRLLIKRSGTIYSVAGTVDCRGTSFSKRETPWWQYKQFSPKVRCRCTLARLRIAR